MPCFASQEWFDRFPPEAQIILPPVKEHDRDDVPEFAWRLAAAVENHTQQLAYFARDLLLDGLRRFFPCGEMASSTGRARQIFSFTSSNSWLSCRKR